MGVEKRLEIKPEPKIKPGFKARLYLGLEVEARLGEDPLAALALINCSIGSQYRTKLPISLYGSFSAEGVLDALHFSDKIGCLDQGARGPSSGEDDVLRRGPLFEGFDHFLGLKKLIFEGNMDLIKNDQLVFRIAKDLAAFFPALFHGLLIDLARSIPRKPAAIAPHPKTGMAHGARRMGFKELDHRDFFPMTYHANRRAERGRCLPFSVSRINYD